MAGFGSDTAGILKKSDIADMVASVFDMPVTADGGGKLCGPKGCLAGIVRDLLGGMPEAGLGVFVQGEARDAGGTDDQPIPIRSEAASNIEDLDGAMLVPTMAVAVDGVDVIDGRAGGRECLQGGGQGRLVVFDLG
jgi:hypothetical protein